MFAPEYVERQRQVTTWVKAAMSAGIIIVDSAMAGTIPPEKIQGFLDSILENAVKEVMKIGIKNNTDPSVN